MIEIINLLNSHTVCPFGLGIPCEDMIKVKSYENSFSFLFTVFIFLSEYVISVLYKFQIRPYAKKLTVPSVSTNIL